MEITKSKPQLSIALEQIKGYFQSVKNAFTRVWPIVAKGFQDLRCNSGRAMEKLRSWSQEAILFAQPKLTRFRSQALLTAKQAAKSLAGALQKSRHALTAAGAGASNLLEMVRSASAKNLQKLLSSSHQAAVAAYGKITELGLQVSAATKELVTPIHKAHTGLVGLRKSVADQPRRFQAARRAKENEVQELLAGSSDAIVLTDIEKRLVAANLAALNLFGISEFNLKNFTINAFLTQNPASEFDENDAFRRDAGRRSQCKIRRLDGCLQVAECVFVAHALPHHHLYKFLKAAPYRIAPPGFGARNSAGSRSNAAEDHGNSIEKTSKAVSKIPRHGVRPVI